MMKKYGRTTNPRMKRFFECDCGICDPEPVNKKRERRNNKYIIEQGLLDVEDEKDAANDEWWDEFGYDYVMELFNED